jgi:hypothetical protein
VGNLTLRAVLLLAAAFAMGADATPPTPSPATEMPVYDTALVPGWDNWSWAKTELSVELKGSTRRPISVAAGPWQALYLHHAAFSTAGLKQLSLLIQGTAPDGEVRIFALVDGKVAGTGHLAKLGNTGWTRVVMPLAELSVVNQQIDGIWVQNASGNDLPLFFVTEIKLE